MVRGIEERLAEMPEADQAQGVDEADNEGYVLTRYFYEALGRFEKDPRGCATLMLICWVRLTLAKKEAGIADSVREKQRRNFCTWRVPGRAACC